MKKLFLSLLASLPLFISGCGNQNEADNLHFATSAEYPPFEYQKQGELKGFDIELAHLVAQQLGKKAVFSNLQFSNILPSLSSGQVDAAIATITITEDRKKNFDFSEPYYFENLALISKKDAAIKTIDELKGKKISCQLGSTMHIWLKQNVPNEIIVTMDSNNQAIEALKAGHVDVVVVDGVQGIAFSKKNPGLTSAPIAEASDGYGIALKKNSPLTAQINQALETLKANGELKKLEQKWLSEDSTW